MHHRFRRRRALLICSAAQAALLLFYGAQAALPEGSVAPDFITDAALAGQQTTFALHQALQQGPVVVYFYPSAYTNGCNVQAHAFSQASAQFAAAGARVVGVSLDRIERLRDFSVDPAYCAGKLAVASDADGAIAHAFDIRVREAPADRRDTRGDAIAHGLAERTTFVIGRDRRIVRVIGGVAPAQNVADALGAVQALAAAQR